MVAEYLWLGGSGTDLRSQARVLQHPPTALGQLPDWYVDGSCSGLALADDFYVYLKPKAFYPDPFRGGNNVLVLCSTYTLKEVRRLREGSSPVVWALVRVCVGPGNYLGKNVMDGRGHNDWCDRLTYAGCWGGFQFWDAARGWLRGIVWSRTVIWVPVGAQLDEEGT